MRRRVLKVVAAATAMFVLGTGVALAGTTVDSGDVGIVGDAGVTPAGATLVRGSSTTFDLTVTADDGSFPSSQCDNVGVTAPTTFIAGSGVLATSGSTTIDFTCPWQHNQNGAQTKTFAGRTLAAGNDAPLGRSDYEVTFGSGGMVTAETQVTFAVTTLPKLYLTVTPRPASALAATPGDAEVTLNWTASDDAVDITDYEIEVSGGKTTTLSAAKNATSMTDSGLTNGTEYCYRIRARFNDGTNDFFSSYEPASGAVCATPESAGPTYSVAFKQPIDGNGIMNKGKIGRVIPVKLDLLADGSEVVGATHGPVTISAETRSCSSAAADTVESYAAGSANDGFDFRWDDAGEQWIYNLDTSKLPGATANKCFEVFANHGGSAIGSFLIQLTK